MLNFDGLAKTGPAQYTGFTNGRVIAINPNKTQLEAMGINVQNEPEYTKLNDSHVLTTRVDIWFELPTEDKAKVKASIFTANEYQTIESKAGDTWTTYTNDKNQFAGSKDGTFFDWFSDEGARESYVGEEDITKFLFALIGGTGLHSTPLKVKIEEITKGNVSQLREIVDYVNGDFYTSLNEEMKAAVVAAKELNQVGSVEILTTIRESNGSFYQSVFNRYFGQPNGKSRAGFFKNEAKQAAKGYRHVRDMYTHNFQEFKGLGTEGLVDPVTSSVEPEVAEAAAMSSDQAVNALLN